MNESVEKVLHTMDEQIQKSLMGYLLDNIHKQGGRDLFISWLVNNDDIRTVILRDKMLEPEIREQIAMAIL